MPPPSFKKRKTTTTKAPAEITFDFAAREEYLTGFHKRKVQRIKHAQEENAKKENEERLRMRRELRIKRKEDLEKHVNEVNSLLRKARSPSPSSSSEKEEFTGFDSPQPQPQPLPEAIDREDEYIDEDKYTTVTIESVGIGKQGFEKVDDEKGVAEGKKEEEGKWPKEKTKIMRPKKIKKPKFRYESKAERKTTRMKQGAKNRAAAQARKGT